MFHSEAIFDMLRRAEWFGDMSEGQARLLRPILIVNPRSDQAFAEAAHRLVEEGADTTAALQRGLRLHFPMARVGERRLSGETTVTWYVYRDGVWSPEGRT